MKSLVLAIALAITTAHSAHADFATYYCREKRSSVGHDSLRSRALRITETQALDPGEFDFRTAVTVEILYIVRGQGTVSRSFEAVATSVDVYYEVDALEQHNFKFFAYLDDDGAWVDERDGSSGEESRTKYNCERVQ